MSEQNQKLDGTWQASLLANKISQNPHGYTSDSVEVANGYLELQKQNKQLQDEVERIHKLGRERASDIADYRDEVKQLQDEIAELKNNPDDPWNGVLNEEGEL